MQGCFGSESPPFFRGCIKGSYFPRINSLDFAVIPSLVSFIGRKNSEKRRFRPGVEVGITILAPNQGAFIMG